MSSHAELIERVEKASGPSLDLDGRIWCALRDLEFIMWDGAGCVYRGKDGIGHVAANNVKPYSASLDAVMALMPDGMEYDITNLYGVARVSVGINCDPGPFYGENECGNMPLALLSAILKARAATANSGASA
jgi:hypothetical protein